MLQTEFQTDSKKWQKPLQELQGDFESALLAAFDALVLPKKNFNVAVSLIVDREMQKLNAQYRSKDKPTNVLSFPLIEDFSDLKKWPEPLMLGDIVLAYETCAKEAKEQGKSFKDHVSHLLVHGLLHLFGYDHMNKKDADEMENLEIDILAGIGIDNPY